MSNKKKISRITTWFDERNYGFLRSAAEGDEENTKGYFLHGSDIVSGQATKGYIVRFDLVAGQKGPAASNAEIFAYRADMDRGDALANAVTALVDSTAPATDVPATAVPSGK